MLLRKQLPMLALCLSLMLRKNPASCEEQGIARSCKAGKMKYRARQSPARFRSVRCRLFAYEAVLAGIAKIDE